MAVRKKSKKPDAAASSLILFQKKKGKGALSAQQSADSFLDQLSSYKSEADRLEMLNAFLEAGGEREEEVSRSFAKKYSLQHIDNLGAYKIPEKITRLVPQKMCQKYHLIPLAKVNKALVVVFCDPSNLHVRENISLITKCHVQPVVAPRSAILKAVEAHYDNESELNSLFYEMDKSAEINFETEAEGDNVVDLDNQGAAKASAAVIQLVNLIFSDAIRLKSSDIHIEVYEKSFRIRYRIDGVLHEKHNLPRESAASVISRIKVISEMDISEKRKPQDARLKVRVGGEELNLRVNSTPTVNGEKIVLRILDDSALKMDVRGLNMEPKQTQIFQEALYRPQGLILMTGPTGSGKTTTIYSGLVQLNTKERNISTVEDPVEFRIQGINQVQVNNKVQLTFAAALKAFLRQDPDIILVGEIRDLETADIAFKAAATGHLVLSTLHTNDTSSTITRLLSMGIPAYNVADNTSLIVSQRLLRKICKSCASPAKDLAPSALEELNIAKKDIPSFQGKIYNKGQGCGDCNELGYKGRLAVYEMMSMSGNLKQAILNRESPKALKKEAVRGGGMLTLRQAALKKLKEGVTSIEEVLRVTIPDDRAAD